MIGISAILILINQLLRMLHSDSGCEVFWHHCNALVKECVIGIGGTVAGSQDDIGRKKCAMVCFNACDLSIFNFQTLHACFKADFTAKRDDLSADIDDHCSQYICA